MVFQSFIVGVIGSDTEIAEIISGRQTRAEAFGTSFTTFVIGFKGLVAKIALNVETTAVICQRNG